VRRFVAQDLTLPAETPTAHGRLLRPKKLTTTSAADAAIGNQCISFELTAADSTRQARVRLPMREIKPIIGLGCSP